ncbi:MAG: phospholipid carrier-dependent glycosyltransferase [Patescibacteria group bacterium]|nr:phospholipid carrier-dependent glycosyltransferase [Patescibacteria group bacterium]
MQKLFPFIQLNHSRIKQLLAQLNHSRIKQLLALFFLLGLALFLRLYHLDIPENPCFDEVYHLPAVRLIQENDPRAYEWWHQPVYGVYHFDWLHPPLVKLVQAVSVEFLGWHSWVWRLPSALAGTMLVGAVYWLTRLLFQHAFSLRKNSIEISHNLALFASFLTAIEGLSLVSSRVAMNDVFVSLFILLSLGSFFKSWLYAQQDQTIKQLLLLLVSGLFLGLGVASKWSAFLVMFGLTIYQLIIIFRKKHFKIIPFAIFSLILIPVAIYCLSYTQMFMQGKSISYFFKLQQQIINYQFLRDASHAYASQPWQWFFNLRPVWYWHRSFFNSDLVANIYTLSNPILMLLTLPALVVVSNYLRCNLKNNLKKQEVQVLAFLLFSYFIAWLPWIFSPRIMFYHHYLPAIPILMIIITYFFRWLKNKSYLSFVLMTLLVVVGFFMFYPHWVGLPVSKTWVEAVYFSLETWR